MKKKEISRRDFLRGTAAGALSVAAAGILGACSSQGGEAAQATQATDAPETETAARQTAPPETETPETEASKEGQTQETDSGSGWLGEAPVIDESQVVKTYDTEVLVVGSGTAGLFAACAAVEEGAKTILIEKFGEAFGGSGIRDTLAAIGSKQQIANNDNPDKFDVITELYRQSNGYGDQRLYKVWADHSGEAIDWYTDILAKANIPFLHEVDDHSHSVRYPVYDVGHSVQMSATEGEEGVTSKIVKEYGQGLGLEIHYDTAMAALIKDGDAVTGLYASTEEGYVRYNASKEIGRASCRERV